MSVTGLTLALGYLYIKDTQSAIHSIWPFLFRIVDPETAHQIAIRLGELRLLPVEHVSSHPSLQTNVLGLSFDNPIGLAAGFDKDGRAIDALGAMGFGAIEIGSITPLPQEGNERPRVFRLIPDEAIINRYGFNSQGLQVVRDRLAHRSNNAQLLHVAAAAAATFPLWKQLSCALFDPGFPVKYMHTQTRLFSLPSLVPSPRPRLGINLGKNKATSDAQAAQDYVAGVQAFGPYADYLVINVSSPNTPGLRTLQASNHIEPLLRAVLQARDALICPHRPPILVKLSPDLTGPQIDDLLQSLRSLPVPVDGLIISNTTTARPISLRDSQTARLQTGGLSGRPLFAPSTALLSHVYRASGGQIPIIAAGGISSAQDIYTKLRAGASLVQLYTALIYQGPGLVTKLKSELAQLLARDGFTCVSQVVGLDAK